MPHALRYHHRVPDPKGFGADALTDVIRAATQNPAQALRRPELGTLAIGTPGDASVLEVRYGPHSHTDVLGESIVAQDRLVARGLVIGGAWWSDGVQ